VDFLSFFLSFFVFAVLGFELRFEILGLELRAFTLGHSTSPIFERGFFEIGSCRTICVGWFQTMTLLMSAS
jgi:hypothetical protein